MTTSARPACAPARPDATNSLQPIAAHAYASTGTRQKSSEAEFELQFRVLTLAIFLGDAPLNMKDGQPSCPPRSFCVGTGFAQQSPDTLYGPLFQNVQMHEVFPDQKTFVDCVPIRKPSEIMADYQRLVKEPNFDLKAFVASEFHASARPG